MRMVYKDSILFKKKFNSEENPRLFYSLKVKQRMANHRGEPTVYYRLQNM